MTQAKTYRAFVKYGNDKPDECWTGLTKGQAQWRYHWIKRNWWNLFRDFREYGWQRED
jgi:hypothetical protein